MVQAELLSIFEPLRKTMNELTSKISENFKNAKPIFLSQKLL